MKRALGAVLCCWALGCGGDDAGDGARTAVSNRPRSETTWPESITLAGSCPDGQECTWVIDSSPGGAAGGELSDPHSPTSTFTPNTHGDFMLRFEDESGDAAETRVVSVACEHPVPYYPAGCLDELTAEIDAVAQLAEVDDRYPTLGEDILPVLPMPPTVNERDNLVEAGNAGDFQTACNGSEHYIKLTADIREQVQCTGSNLIIDLGGHSLGELIAANLGGGLRQTEVRGPGRLGRFTQAQEMPVDDITLRFLILGGDDVSDQDSSPVAQLSAAGANRWLIVNSVILGHDASDPGHGNNSPIMTTSSRDWIIANVNAFVPRRNPQEDIDSGWGARLVGERLVFIDVMLLAEYNRVVRRGPGTAFDGYAMYSSVWARDTPRKSTQIELEQAYVDGDLMSMTDRIVNLHVRYEVDNRFANSSHFGADQGDGSGGLWLIHAAEVRTSQTGFFGRPQWDSLQSLCPGGKICNYDVGGLNTFVEDLSDPLEPSAPPVIADPELGELAESDPAAIEQLEP